jgi:uncharacterized damage-inducible protein DinB
MITVEYCRTMASYNAWQNRGVMEIMKGLPEKELLKDRKGFFGSIFKTANHLLWGDLLWIKRFDGGFGPRVETVDESIALHETLDLWLGDRLRTDDRITRWAGKLRQVDLVGNLAWHSTSTGNDMEMPQAMCIVHFFNHQTHHRGQLHAMFTAAGFKPSATDLVLMPG